MQPKTDEIEAAGAVTVGDVVTAGAELAAEGGIPDDSGWGAGTEICDVDDGCDGCEDGRTAGSDCWSTTTSIVGWATVAHEEEEGSAVAERKGNWRSSKTTCLDVITHHD